MHVTAAAMGIYPGTIAYLTRISCPNLKKQINFVLFEKNLGT